MKMSKSSMPRAFWGVITLALIGSIKLAFGQTFTEIWSGENLPVSTGGHGVAWADADDDGRPDLYATYIANGRTILSELFIYNQGDGHFTEEAYSRGVEDDNDGGSHGAAWADLDNDGDYDLINGATVDRTGGFANDAPPEGNDVYRNDGHGRFTRVTPGVIADRKEPTRAFIALDWDNDGDLDLFGLQGGQTQDHPNELYRNDGDFNFSAITDGDAYHAGEAMQGAIGTDFDGDGDVDILAANRNGSFVILRNDGSGSFTQITPSSIGLPNGRAVAGDGISTADVNNDGYLDILLVDASTNLGILYLNDGEGTFTYLRDFSKIDGYMGGFADLDNDGDLDLVFAGDNRMYTNDGSGHFSDGPSIPVLGLNDPRAIAFADFDDDGDVDFAVAAKNSRNFMWRNDLTASSSGQWLKVRLISPQGQAGAFGAKTRIYAAGDEDGIQLGLRESKSNYGYLGQDDPVLHFGLGSRSTVDVVVDFLDGTQITVTNVDANQTILIDGRPETD